MQRVGGGTPHTIPKARGGEGLRGTEGKSSLKKADKGQAGDGQLCLRPAPVGSNVEPIGQGDPLWEESLRNGVLRETSKESAQASGSFYLAPQPLLSLSPQNQCLPPFSGHSVASSRPHPGWEVRTEGQGRYGKGERQLEGARKWCNFHLRLASECDLNVTHTEACV